MDVRDLTTKQQMFDYVADFLIKQGTRSMLPGSPDICAYRGDNGTMCAVGCLLHDDEYNPDWEASGVYSVAEDEAAPERIKDNVEFLFDLQCAHDDHLGSNVEDFKEQLLDIAVKHDLQVNFA